MLGHWSAAERPTEDCRRNKHFPEGVEPLLVQTLMARPDTCAQAHKACMNPHARLSRRAHPTRVICDVPVIWVLRGAWDWGLVSQRGDEGRSFVEVRCDTPRSKRGSRTTHAS